MNYTETLALAKQKGLDVPNAVFVLDRDVKNPQADRRVTRQWTRFPRVRKGTRFHTNVWPHPLDPSILEISLRLVKPSGYSMHELVIGQELFAELLPYLTPVEPTLDDFLLTVNGDALIRHLITTKQVTFEQLQTARNQLNTPVE